MIFDLRGLRPDMLPFPWIFVMKSSYTEIFDMLNRYRTNFPSLYICLYVMHTLPDLAMVYVFLFLFASGIWVLQYTCAFLSD